MNRPCDTKPIASRFVFSRKRHNAGKVVRHKARVVAKGFLQGNVHRAFAPVLDFITVHICLSVAV